MAEKKIGFDTGFFIKVLQGNKTAITIWENIQKKEAVGFVSCLSIFEIKRLMLKGAIDKESADIILKDIKYSCNIIWIDEEEILSASTKISHGNGIPAIDSLILASLINSKIKVIYTTDAHFNEYKKKGFSIVKL